MARIVIDAGHGGAEPGAVYNGRKEKDDTLALALKIGEILTANGVDVVYTRTEDFYQTPFQKATIGNQEEGDFFLSIHRNSSPMPNQYFGAETLVYENSGIKRELGENINSELEKAGFRNLGIKERPDLVVLKRTRMPAVLVEAGFINTDADNRTFDENFEETAAAVANGVLMTLRDNGMLDGTNQNGQYAVQTGAFRNKSNAEKMVQRLVADGFSPYLDEREGLFRVLNGQFSTVDEAASLEQKLRRAGYATVIVSRS